MSISLFPTNPACSFISAVIFPKCFNLEEQIQGVEDGRQLRQTRNVQSVL